jgi:hypothetical protein
MYAASKGDLKCMKRLLQQGANTTLVDKNGANVSTRIKISYIMDRIKCRYCIGLVTVEY